MEYIIDIAIGVAVLLGLISGFITGGIKKFLRIVLFIASFIGLYYGFKGIAVDFIRYDLLNLLTKNEGFSLVLNDLTIKVTNFEDLFIVLQNVDENLSGLLLKTTCEAACNAIFVLALLLVTDLVSYPISFVLYHLFFKFLLFRAGKKPKFIGRFIGGLLGIVQAFIYVYIFGIAAGQLGFVATDLLKLVEEAGLQGSNVATFVDVTKYISYSLDYEHSMILGSIIDALSNSTLNLNSLVSVKFEGKEMTLKDCLTEISSTSRSGLVDLIKTLFTPKQDSTAPETTAKVAELYNLSFNF